MTRPPPHRSAINTRRGAVYLLVLSASAIVTVVGVAGVLLVQNQRRALKITHDAAQARLHALTTIEAGFQMAENIKSWRDAVAASGGTIFSRSFAGGTVTLSASDPTDATLNDSLQDPVDLLATGQVGEARQMLRVRLTPSNTPVDSFAYAAYAGGPIAFSAAYVTAPGTIGSNGNITASSSTILPRVEAAGTIAGSGYAGGSAGAQPARTLPDATTLIDTYVAMGTEIPHPGGAGRLQKILLSPASNPYGAPNPSGIYYINCAGSNLRISNIRVLGTLIILDPGATSEIDAACLFEATSPEKPCLMVRGTFAFNTPATDFLEVTVGGNLNPAGSPYRGVTDTDTADAYPCLFAGIVYATGGFVVRQPIAIDGKLFVGGALTLNADLTLRDGFMTGAPLGFTAAGGFSTDATQFTQVVD